MDVNEALSSAQDAVTVKRVFAEPYEKDGVTVIAAARVSGGGGAGTGNRRKGSGGGEAGTDVENEGGEGKAGEGEGGGFGMGGKPAGAFVIRNGEVRWMPAFDPQKLLAIAAITLVTVMIVKSWTRTRAMKIGR